MAAALTAPRHTAPRAPPRARDRRRLRQRGTPAAVLCCSLFPLALSRFILLKEGFGEAKPPQDHLSPAGVGAALPPARRRANQKVLLEGRWPFKPPENIYDSM